MQSTDRMTAESNWQCSQILVDRMKKLIRRQLIDLITELEVLGDQTIIVMTNVYSNSFERLGSSTGQKFLDTECGGRGLEFKFRIYCMDLHVCYQCEKTFHTSSDTKRHNRESHQDLYYSASNGSPVSEDENNDRWQGRLPHTSNSTGTDRVTHLDEESRSSESRPVSGAERVEVEGSSDNADHTAEETDYFQTLTDFVRVYNQPEKPTGSDLHDPRPLDPASAHRAGSRADLPQFDTFRSTESRQVKSERNTPGTRQSEHWKMSEGQSQSSRHSQLATNSVLPPVNGFLAQSRDRRQANSLSVIDLTSDTKRNSSENVTEQSRIGRNMFEDAEGTEDDSIATSEMLPTDENVLAGSPLSDEASSDAEYRVEKQSWASHEMRTINRTSPAAAAAMVTSGSRPEDQYLSPDQIKVEPAETLSLAHIESMMKSGDFGSSGGTVKEEQDGRFVGSQSEADTETADHLASVSMASQLHMNMALQGILDPSLYRHIPGLGSSANGSQSSLPSMALKPQAGQLSRATTYRQGTKKAGNYHCQVCGKYFVSSSMFRFHMRTHNEIRPYVCELCNKCFKDKETLKRHRRTHSGEKPYTCNICERKFNHTGSLSNHKKRHRMQGVLFSPLS